MTIPVLALTLSIWLAIAGVATGAVHLAVIAIRDWRARKLW